MKEIVLLGVGIGIGMYISNLKWKSKEAAREADVRKAP